MGRVLSTLRFYSLVFFISGGLLVSCGSPTPVSINIVYSSEKAEWLEQLITEYNQLQPQVRVQGFPTGSIESISEIIDEINSPTVWSPASSIEIPLAREKWRQIYKTELIEETPRSLVLSPVVIAMWREMAEALGWPEKSIGWLDIAKLATSERGWLEYGHEEWGVFKLGYTNPEFSNSGLVSILAIAYAVTGKQSTLRSTDFTDPALRTFMENVLTNVSQYERSTGFFAQGMFHCEYGGPSYLSAAILYENLVVAQERKRLEGKECEAKHPPIVAIYPVEGTFWSDHPYVILNAPWVTDKQKAAARAFEAFLLAEPQQRRAMEFGYRPADPKISYVSPLISAHGIDLTQPSNTLQSPSASIMRELLKLWVTN